MTRWKRCDSEGQRGGLPDVEIATELDEQRRGIHSDDIDPTSVVERSKRVHTVVTFEEFVPDPLGDRHGRKPLANQVESVDKCQIEKG